MTVAVPSSHVEHINAVFKRGFATCQTENQCLLKALPSGFHARLILLGMCSCGLYIPPPKNEPRDEIARHLKKYKRQGWSESKIQRAIEQIKSKEARKPIPMVGIQPDITRRIEELCRLAGSVAVFVRWYDDDIETAKYDPGAPQRCTCAQLSAAAHSFVEGRLLIASG